MIYCYFFIGCLLAYFCYKYKKQLEAQENIKGAAYAFGTTAFEVLVPFTLVTLFYSILSYSLSDIGSDQTTLATLHQYEKKLQQIQTWLKYLKLSSTNSFLLMAFWFFVVLIVRVRLGQSKGEQLEKIYAKYESYNKWVKHISTTVVLLTSFTFFSSNITALGKEVRVSITTTRENYNTLASKIDVAITEAVTNEIYRKVKASAPPDYLRLEKLYAQTEVEPRERKIATLVSEAEKLPAQTSKLENSYEKLENRINRNKLSALVHLMENYLNKAAVRVDPVLQTTQGKKIIPAMLSQIITHKNIPGVANVVAEVRILEPILSVFEKAFSKEVEVEIKNSLQQLVDKAVNTPDINLEREIENEAKKIVEKTTVNWEEVKSEKIVAIETKLKAEMDSSQKRYQDLSSQKKDLLNKLKAQHKAALLGIPIESLKLPRELKMNSFNAEKMGKILEEIRRNNTESKFPKRVGPRR